MIKITGLDKLTQQFKEAQKAIALLEGELGIVTFTPNDPASIEAAIQEVEDMVDSRLSPYSSNTIIGPIAKAMKEQYRTALIERASIERVKNSTNND